jgi:hypothetical protein
LGNEKPLFTENVKELNYGDIDFLCGFVPRFYDERKETSLLVFIMAISQIQIDFVLSSSSGIWIQQRGGNGNSPNVYNFGIILDQQADRGFAK